MKICFIAPKAYPIFNKKIKSIFGGAEVQLYLLSKEFSNYPHVNVSFIVADYGQNDVEVYEKVRVYKSFDLRQNIVKSFFNFFRIFNKVKADVYVQRTLSPVSGILALYCKFTGRKFVYMVAHDYEVDGGYDKNNGFLKSYIANLVFKFADLIVVQNMYEFENLCKRNKSNNLVILNKGIDFNNLSEETPKIFDVIWVGRCEKWKNPDIFLQLAKKNEDKKFLIIVPVSNTNPKLFSVIEKKAMSIKNLTFLKHVSNDEVYRYLSKSKIFVITSQQEGNWPMVVLEAISSKVPIISLSLNYGELLKDDAAGIFCNNNFDIMNKKLNQLLNDVTLYKQMSKNAYKYSKIHYDIQKNAKHFYYLIRDELYVNK